MRKKLTKTALLAILLISASCTERVTNSVNNPYAETGSNVPKYIIFLIGDGMSSPQINIAEAALNEPEFIEAYHRNTASKANRSTGAGGLSIRKLPVTGMATTYAEDRYITCSAAAATALATGNKTTINTISMNGNRTKSYKTMAEMAKEKGMKVGIVTSVSIDHATPACFYAHTPDRNNYEEIGNQLLTSGFDYFGGGSVRWNKRKTLTTADEYKTAGMNQGYKFVDTKAEFNALNSSSGKVIATLSLVGTNGYTGDGSSMPYVVDWNKQRNEDKISLADFTKKGFELLDNENGFFMMVESGKIDWACHANDVGSTVYDMLAFDDVIAAALDFYNQHPDETLIIITGDHECGGLTLGFAATEYENAYHLLKAQNTSFQEFSSKVSSWAEQSVHPSFEAIFPEVTAAFGLENKYTDKEQKPNYLKPTFELSDYEYNKLKQAFEVSMNGKKNADILPEDLVLYYGTYDPFTVTITHILNNKAGVDWATYSHTGVPVPVFAIGQGQRLFEGYYDNTDIAKKIIEIAELK